MSVRAFYFVSDFMFIFFPAALSLYVNVNVPHCHKDS